MKSIINPATKKEQRLANESLLAFTRALARDFQNKYDVMHIQIQDTSEIITVPRSAFDLFMSILNNMAAGNAVSVVPSATELTTQEAADMLNVSRPYLVQLLETGKIPFKKTGTHRRVRLSDLQRYRTRLETQRTKSLAKLAAQAQDLDLGYE
jgi:excisionase family DNA binding protein